MEIHCPGFIQGGTIPRKYTCDGVNERPELQFSKIPEAAKSFAIIMEDPDAPNGTFVHWVAWNLPVQEIIGQGLSMGKEGMTSWGTKGYKGPCPPEGIHRYFFLAFALDCELKIREADKQKLLNAMEGHVLASAELMGSYSRE